MIDNRSRLSLAFASMLMLMLMLAGCSGGTSQDNAPDPTALVSVAIAQSGGVASTQAIYGAVEQNADTQFNLSAPVEAIVSRIAAPVGSAVGRGQLVVALSASPSTRAQFSQAEANATVAEAALARARRLRADGLVSDAEVESARATAQGASAAREALSLQRGELALRAPVPGHVQSIASSPGDLVASGATIATISRDGDLRARFGIDPALISRLSRGSGLRLSLLGRKPDITVPIASVDPSVDVTTQLASVYASVPAAYGVKAGQSLTGHITLEKSTGALTVPYEALLDDGGQPYVFVVSGGVAHRRDVEVSAFGLDSVAIAKGIRAGEQVVVKGGTALEDDMKVRLK